MKRCLALALLALLVITTSATAASLTKPITLAWEQEEWAFVAPSGSNTIPLNSWKLYQKDSETGPVTGTVAVPYDPSKLSVPVGGYRTYIYGPMQITATGVGGTTVKKCWHATALGNDTTPPSETGPSNTVCEDFVLPPDPIRPPGTPGKLQVKP